MLPGALGVAFDKFKEEIFCDGTGSGPAVILLAFLGSLDHDRDGDLGILYRSKANEPSEVDFFSVSAEIGGTGLTCDSKVVDSNESTRAPASGDALHALPEEGALTRVQPEGFSAVIDGVLVLGILGEDGGLGAGFIAGERGGETSHAQGGGKEEALPDGGVGGITRNPTGTGGFAFPFFRGHDIALGLVGEFDASFFIEAKTLCFRTEYINSHGETLGIKEDVAATFNGFG